VAIICPDAGLLFLMAPRTGCTALGEGVLIPELNGSYLPDVDIISSQGILEVSRKHSTLCELLSHGVLDERIARLLLKFTTVRNPFDSLYTLYIKQSRSYQRYLGNDESFLHYNPAFAERVRRSRDLSFNKWLVRRFGRRKRLRAALRAQRQLDLYRAYTEGADVILKFESLQRDFDALLASRDLPPIQIPQINRTVEREHSYRDVYSRAGRRLVERHYSQYMERYGYEF
jgi:hypothetical protein